MNINYSIKTKGELIVICKQKGITGYSNKKKKEILELLLSLEKSNSGEILDEDSEAELNTAVEEIIKNTFYVGDNIYFLKNVLTESIDMIYLDPPYNTGRDFHYFVLDLINDLQGYKTYYMYLIEVFSGLISLPLSKIIKS